MLICLRGVNLLCLTAGAVAIFGCGGDSTCPGVQDTLPPAAIGDLSIQPSALDSTATLVWTAPGDDGTTGRASTYDVRYSTFPATTSNWWETLCIALPDPPDPKAPGEREEFSVGGLLPDTTYYFAVRAADEHPNWSGLSNVASLARGSAMPPSQVVDLTVAAVSDLSVTLAWTAPGSDGSSGTAAAYDIRYSRHLLSPESWDEAYRVASPPRPMPAGSREDFAFTGMAVGIDYNLALRAVDEQGHWSSLSNVARVRLGGLTAPSRIADLRVASTTSTTTTLEWTASGDDGVMGAATEYQLVWSEDEFTAETWSQASTLPIDMLPGDAGSPEAFTATNLARGTTYWWALRAGDDAGLWSDLSPIVSGRTTDSFNYRVPSALCPTILSAANLCLDGDTITVAAGTYSGPGNADELLIDKALVLQATDGPEHTVIDFAGEGWFALGHPQSTTAHIIGFTFMNNTEYDNAGLYATNCRVSDCVFVQNTHGLACSGQVDVNNCTIAQNLKMGITCRGGGSAITVVGSSIVENGWTGVFCDDYTTSTIRNCTISRNQGGVTLWGESSTSIDSCVIADNHSTDNSYCHGGVFFRGSGARGTVSRSEVTDNGSYEGGAGITAEFNSHVAVSDCVVAHNGGVGVYGLAELTIARTAITNNRGGGLLCEGTIQAEDLVISGNETSGSGGGVSVGGAGDPGQAQFTRCVIVGNRALGYGGGLYAWSLSLHPAVEMIGCTVAGNHSANGGGLAIRHSQMPVVRESVVWGNCAVGRGGEVFLADDASCIFECCAVDSAEIENDGSGEIEWVGGQSFVDPAFCGEVSCLDAPSSDGDYSLKGNSPCLEANSPCGELIGARGWGCEVGSSRGR